MAKKQRWYRLGLPDSMADAIIARLKAKWGLANDSELITKLLVEADKCESQ
jgi:hypothetical protein